MELFLFFSIIGCLFVILVSERLGRSLGFVALFLFIGGIYYYFWHTDPSVVSKEIQITDHIVIGQGGNSMDIVLSKPTRVTKLRMKRFLALSDLTRYEIPIESSEKE
jgi:hypothetical protein